MSERFGAPRPRQPRPGADRRRKVLVPTLVTLAALLFLGSIFTSVWTDRLWFDALGYAGVFSTLITTRVLLFTVFGVIFGLFVLANLVIAYRTRPPAPPARRDDPAYRYRTALTPIVKPVFAGAAIVLGVFAGSVATGQWENFLMWRNGTPFGKDDPHFGKDIGFYIFDYDWLRFLVSYAFALVVVSVLIVAFIHYVYGGIRLAGRGSKFTRAARTHLAILVGIGVLVRAASYYLDRFGYAISSSGLVDGITYTDANARIPSKNILIAVAIVCALILFASVFFKSWMLPGIGLGLLILSSILIGGIWPALMQSFEVEPSEPSKEAPYIARNIEATRAAFGLSGVESQPYTAKTSLSASELTKSAETRVSTRLIDPTLVAPAFEQLRQVRGYYSVPPTLDVDRYDLKGKDTPQDIVIAARELNLSGLADSQRNWANDHTVYTHGYGVIAALGNKRGPQGEPVFVTETISGDDGLQITEPPRIYYGENSPTYSIVGRPEGAAPIEIDIPRGTDAGDNAENATQNTYQGEGGVPIGGLFNKILYAFKFGEPNIVLSNRVNDNSKILYDRSPRERVNKVAPWLTADGNTYPAIVDGRVVWIVDAYTTSNSYPYSQSRSLEDATSDSLTDSGAQAVLPRDQVNYIRNSVKAVVDAADGTVTLYQWDTEDPLLKTWMKVFPDVVQPKSEIPDGLREHLRYPVDLFKVQRDVLTRYHITDPQTFYEDSERWKVPEDPSTDGNSLQPPYYLSVTRPGTEVPEFTLTSVFVPNSRQNLAAFVSVGSEATNPKTFGEIQILELPTQTQVPGPSQIANQFQSDQEVSQALLQYKQAGTTILHGNLLTVPVGDSLLYVQPIYIQRSAAEGSYPVLQFVIASFGKEVGFGQTLDEALRSALGLEAPDAGSDADDNPVEEAPPEDPAPDDAEAPPEPKSVTALLETASKQYDLAQKALADGDLAEYQKRITAMGDAIDKARKALDK